MPKSFLLFLSQIGNSNWYCKILRIYKKLTRKINPIGPIQTMIEKPVSKLIPDIPRVMKLRHLRNIITRRHDIEIFRHMKKLIFIISTCY